MYIAPELEIVKYNLRDVIMASPIEGSIPEVSGGDLPGEDATELPDLPDLP